MLQTLLSLCLVLSKKTPKRSAPRYRPAFRRLSCRPRLEALEDRCLLSAGALDPTFGNGAGYVTTSVSNATIYGAQSVLLQPDGKIIDVGVANNFAKHGTFQGSDFAAVRYNADGTLDTSFGSAGLALVSPTSISSGSSMSDVAAALYPNTGTANDGKIVVEASYLVTQGKKNQTPIDELALVRFNSNGTVDTTFGSGGEVLTLFSVGGTNVGVLHAGVVLTSTGQIVECGETSTGTVLARFNANGTLDTTFGQGGKVFTPGPQAQNLIQESNGQLLAVGWEGNSGTVVRYNVDGTVDTTFGSGGVVTNAAFGAAGIYGVAVYPAAGTANDGKIVVAGGGGEVARYNTNGTLDSTFGSGGMVNTLRSVAIQADGKVVVSGDGSILERYNADGSLDATFGTGGIDTTTVPAKSLTSVVIQANGDIVAAGQASTFLVARFLPSEPEIGSFTASPSTVSAGSTTTLTASSITDLNANSSITQVTFYYYDSTGTKQTLGTGTQTSPGVWTLNYTVNLATGTYTIDAQAEDSYGVFGDPLALTLTVQ
jgi:uncharacterized delta-60 repeat protein